MLDTELYGNSLVISITAHGWAGVCRGWLSSGEYSSDASTTPGPRHWAGKSFRLGAADRVHTWFVNYVITNGLFCVWIFLRNAGSHLCFRFLFSFSCDDKPLLLVIVIDLLLLLLLLLLLPLLLCLLLFLCCIVIFFTELQLGNWV